ncbi:uncharacterized protein [Scyliorhinus torazame]|uniref:uncharacterized protein isoform X4 n=1 Tax=Scyliorhinus torazame TaxID=75743 RepID=UPI003B59D2BE
MIHPGEPESNKAFLPLADHRFLVVAVMSKTWAKPPTRANGRCAESGEEKIECEKIITEELRAVPLHHRPEFVEACADLINEEWKRSKTSRIHSLQKSSNSFPVCLVLIRTPKNDCNPRIETKGQLMGHSRLSHVVGKPTALFVETVVIAKELRGKGYGRKLMEATEAYAQLRGFKTLYLTTHDKQHFYSHLGYVLTKPVQNAGSMTSFVHMEFLERLSLSSTVQPSCNTSHSQSSETASGCSGIVSSGTSPHPTSPNSSSARSYLQTTIPTPNPPAISPPFKFLPRPTLQMSAPAVSASAQICGLNPPPPLHPTPSSRSNESITSPSTSLVTCSSQPGQYQAPVSCISTTQQLDTCIPIPPPPPQLSQFPCHSNIPGDEHKPFKEKEDTTQNQLETPYRDVKGFPVFWMKKEM